MMAQRHLHELLMEDQEPFHLKDYIADRHCQLKTRPNPKSTLHLKKIQTSTSKLSMCRHACFFSFNNSPDVTKSPFIDLPSPANRSPCKSPNSVFLQILEAAARIQNQSSAKPKSQVRSNFALFGSILKRLKDKNRIKKREIVDSEVRLSAKDGEGKSMRKCEKVKENAYDNGFSCSCSHSRLSSAAWSESNEEKDIETSSCSSPSSPFRFSLQRSPSTGRRTPEFLSPASSPAHPSKEEEHNYEESSFQKVEEEEEKEHCSPVSVLEPPFEDDEIGHEEEGADDYDLECSYAIVQKVKQQLLCKLRRFERLAELDPIELERRMLEEQDDHEEDLTDETEFTYKKQENAEIVKEVFGKMYSHYVRKVPADTNRLVLDLVYEEKRNGVEDSEVVKRVCKRLDSVKEVESNTIDMMVELDFRSEIDGWKRNDEKQMRETVMEIEFEIFGVLMEELSEELVTLF